MPQTSYLLDQLPAVAGQLVERECVVGRYQCSEAITPGRLCELHTDGKLRHYRGGKKVGIAIYKSAKEPGAYAIDDYVPVCREGQIWADFKGTAASATELGEVNFRGADTTATDRGKATEAVPTGAADAQIFDGGRAKFVGAPTADAGLALVECDFLANDIPGACATLAAAFTANDFAPAAIQQDAVYAIGATGAASTVSLPTAAPDGTRAYFSADGTANGHTVTYRDVATAISAAATASKRHLAVAIKAGGKWTVALVVGP